MIDATSFRASPSPERISRLLSTAGEFQSSASPPASLWLSLLGVLSSLAHLVPGGRLRMRSLLLCLHRSWDRLDLEAPVSVSQECLRDLQWWLHLPRLSSGVSLCQVSPDLHFWSDAFRRGVGCPSRPSGRFRPVGLASGSVVHQRQGTVGRTAGSSPVPVLSTRSHGGCLLRQHHGGGVSPQGGRHEVSSPQLLGPGDLALDRVSFHPPGSTISSGLQQCPRGRSVSPPPAPTFRVVAKHNRLSVFKKVLAGPNRLVCHLRKSALFDLLLTIPRSDVSRHRRVSPVLGRAPSLCVPSSGHHSACSSEAPGLLGDGAQWWLCIGPSVLGSRTCSSFRWPLL